MREVTGCKICGAAAVRRMTRGSSSAASAKSFGLIGNITRRMMLGTGDSFALRAYIATISECRKLSGTVKVLVVNSGAVDARELRDSMKSVNWSWWTLTGAASGWCCSFSARLWMLLSFAEMAPTSSSANLGFSRCALQRNARFMLLFRSSLLVGHLGPRTVAALCDVLPSYPETPSTVGGSGPVVRSKVPSMEPEWLVTAGVR